MKKEKSKLYWFLNHCISAEIIGFALLFILQIWIDNDWWIEKCLNTNLILLLTTILFIAAEQAPNGKTENNEAKGTRKP